MKTIQATATVTAGGTMTVQVPPGVDLPPGEHRVVVIEDGTSPQAGQAVPFDLPVIHVGKWPEGLSLRREDMYGDIGR